MDNTDENKSVKKIDDLKTRRIKKNVLKETDEEFREEVEDFMKRYINDTLTGL